MTSDNSTLPNTESDIVKAVENEAIFWSCPRLDVVRAMAHMELVSLKHAEQIYVRGQKVNYTYLIISGVISISNRPGEVAELTQGFLGEEALVGMTCYLGSAVARGDLRLLAIPKEVGIGLSQTTAFREGLVESLNNRILQQDRTEPFKRPLIKTPGS